MQLTVPRPIESTMPLPPACSQLHGYELPASRPSPVYNRFVDLYTADGKALRFASLDEVCRAPPEQQETATLTHPVTDSPRHPEPDLYPGAPRSDLGVSGHGASELPVGHRRACRTGSRSRSPARPRVPVERPRWRHQPL